MSARGPAWPARHAPRPSRARRGGSIVGLGQAPWRPPPNCCPGKTSPVNLRRLSYTWTGISPTSGLGPRELAIGPASPATCIPIGVAGGVVLQSAARGQLCPLHNRFDKGTTFATQRRTRERTSLPLQRPQLAAGGSVAGRRVGAAYHYGRDARGPREGPYRELPVHRRGGSTLKMQRPDGPRRTLDRRLTRPRPRTPPPRVGVAGASSMRQLFSRSASIPR